MTTKGYIRYRGDYKYQLADGYEINISIKPKTDSKTEFIDLDINGNLKVKKGYAWDGPSGPVIDTKENLRASLVHDALYQLMRHRKLISRTHTKGSRSNFTCRNFPEDFCTNTVCIHLSKKARAAVVLLF